jgi:hypothetical protein
MADETQLLYLEPDDEITTVIRRLRESEAPRVVLVASGRSKATSSAVALRLLAQLAADEGRQIALVADGGARALAAEAGIPAFASVTEASAEGAVPVEQSPARRAPIHVVRGEPEPAAPELSGGGLPSAEPVMASRGMEETQAVAVQRVDRYPVPRQPVSAPVRPMRRPARPRRRIAAWVLPAVALVLLVGAGAALATVLPAATVVIHPQASAIGPLTYTVRPELHTPSAEPLSATKQGEATGHRLKRTAATGVVTFLNSTNFQVFVPSGTQVSVGKKTAFRTTQAVTVPDAFFGPGTADAPIEAVDRGPEGNVAAERIDTIDDKDLDRELGGPRYRTVLNHDATSGGDEQRLMVVRKSDISAVRETIVAALEQQLAAQREESGEDRIYASGGAPKAKIDIPDDLEGHASADPYTFELQGTLQDDQPYVLRNDVVAAATERVLQDSTAVPAGRAIESDTISVEVGEASATGDRIDVTTQVTAQAAPQYDESAIAGQIAGMTAAGAEAKLRPIGRTTVSLWPFWVDRVPGIGWRVSVDIRPVEPSSP